jgi:membrane-associated phospholipid phosphatase
VYDDRHWSSDVVGGALVGIGTSRLVLHQLHARGGASGTGPAALALIPLPGGVAVTITH